MKKKCSALLLIEFQNEWLSEEGKLYPLIEDKVFFNRSVVNAKKVLDAAREKQFPVIHSGLSFEHNYSELGEAKVGLRAHIPKRQTFLKDTYGSEFSKEFKPVSNEFVVQGRVGSSAFSGSNLDSYLRNNSINTLYMMGYALHVCVESTMRAAHDLGYDVVLVEDSCSAFNREQYDYVRHNVVSHFASAISAENFLEMLESKDE